LWKDQYAGNPNALEEAIQEAETQWAPFTAANYDTPEAFNNTFLAVFEAKPQLLMQMQNSPEALFTVGKEPTLVTHRFIQGHQGNCGVLFTWDQISNIAPFPMYWIQGQTLRQHECFTRIKTSHAQMPTWAEASQAFQDDGTQQALALVAELPDDAARVGKAIFVPKYVAAILPTCYTARSSALRTVGRASVAPHGGTSGAFGTPVPVWTLCH
jgi:hypothetical protein